MLDTGHTNASSNQNRIRALDPTVVNRIAAGEIIVSPSNALKELLENCLDARAHSVDVLADSGGSKLLQVSDDGHGIAKEDLPLLCERFTTSKLSKFEDLEQVATYGFRGEALASISHVARVTVITRTAEDQCAWRVSYAEGRMLGDPRPVARNYGTTIQIEDLFYNMPSRQRSLRAPSEEYSRLVDVVARYAIQTSETSFSCKKSGEAGFTLSVKQSLGTRDRIRVVFGNSVASDLFEFCADAQDTDTGLQKFHGYASNLSYTIKKSVTPIFFINGRLVTCDPLRRAIMNVYMSYMPKGFKPFIYLSLEIQASHVDVNIHPTKREVRFLNQDEIIEHIALQLHDQLAKIDTSRTFKTGSILTRSGKALAANIPQSSSNQSTIHGVLPSTPVANKPRRDETKLVRTDSSQVKITSFLRQSSRGSSTEKRNHNTSIISPINREKTSGTCPQSIEDGSITSSKSVNQYSEHSDCSLPNRNDDKDKYSEDDSERNTVTLASVQNLRDKVDFSADQDLTNIFANLSYVGIIDEEKRLAAIQYDLKLYMIDYAAVCFEYFYQSGLVQFANFGKIRMETESHEGLSLVSLLSTLIPEDEEQKKNIISKLWDMREMLDEYFSVELIMTNPIQTIETHDWQRISIKSIPLLLKDYNPPLSKLPFFIYRLGIRVNWINEQECLEGILRQIALLYVPEILKKPNSNANFDSAALIADHEKNIDTMSDILEYAILPQIKKKFLATKNLFNSVTELANLPGLYKVFERC